MTAIQVNLIGAEEMNVIEGYPAIVVCRYPPDFPGQFVARLWDIHAGTARPTEVIVVDDTLQGIRDRIRGNGLHPILRMPDDDPCIMEVWI